MSDRPSAAIAEPPRKIEPKTHHIPKDQLTPKEKGIPFPFTSADIRETKNENAVIHAVVKALDKNLPISADMVCTLFSKAAEEREIKEDYDRDLKEIHESVPYPPSAYGEKKQELNTDNSLLSNPEKDWDAVIKPGVSTTFPKGFDYRSVDFEPLDSLGYFAFKRLPAEGKREVIKWILSLNDHGYKPNTITIGFQSLVISTEASRNIEMIPPFLDYIYKHRDSYKYRNTPEYAKISQSEAWEWSINDLASNLFSTRPEVALQEIASRPEEERSKLLSVIVDTCGYPRVIDSLRELAISPQVPREKREQLEAVGKVLLALSPEQTFHTSLNSVYEALRDSFREYTPNVDANEKELTMIENVIKNLIEKKRLEGTLGDGITVADLGCGTGRITKGLAEKNLPGVKEIIGIDNSPDLLDVATIELAKLNNDSITPASYKRGAWNSYTRTTDETGKDIYTSDLNLPPQSVDVLVCIGRTLTHAEDTPRFMSIINQMAKALKPGGILIFDFPDPNKGAYVENRKKMLHVFQSIGIPIRDDQLDTIDMVVDSADGQNLYNRFVPQQEAIISTVNSRGFDTQELARAPIAGNLWEGSENVYYLAHARKLRDSKQFGPRISMADWASISPHANINKN